MFETCRICLKSINVVMSPYFHLESEPSSTSSHCKFKIVIPEVDLNIPKQIFLCKLCHESLERTYQFRLQCIRTENIIKKYVNSKRFMNLDEFDLKAVAFEFSDLIKSLGSENIPGPEHSSKPQFPQNAAAFNQTKQLPLEVQQEENTRNDISPPSEPNGRLNLLQSGAHVDNELNIVSVKTEDVENLTVLKDVSEVNSARNLTNGEARFHKVTHKNTKTFTDYVNNEILQNSTVQPSISIDKNRYESLNLITASSDTALGKQEEKHESFHKSYGTNNELTVISELCKLVDDAASYKRDVSSSGRHKSDQFNHSALIHKLFQDISRSEDRNEILECAGIEKLSPTIVTKDEEIITIVDNEIDNYVPSKVVIPSKNNVLLKQLLMDKSPASGRTFPTVVIKDNENIKFVETEIHNYVPNVIIPSKNNFLLKRMIMDKSAASGRMFPTVVIKDDENITIVENEIDNYVLSNEVIPSKDSILLQQGQLLKDFLLGKGEKLSSASRTRLGLTCTHCNKQLTNEYTNVMDLVYCKSCPPQCNSTPMSAQHFNSLPIVENTATALHNPTSNKPISAQHFNNLSRVENTALHNSTPNKLMSPQHFNNLPRAENTALHNSTPNKQMSPQHFNNLPRVENTALHKSTPNKPISAQHFNNLSRVENTALHNSTPNKQMSPQHFNNLPRVENTALHNSTPNKPMSAQHFNNLSRVENTTIYNSIPNKQMSPQHFNNLSRVENTALHNSTPNKQMSPQHFNNLSRVENTALYNSTPNKQMSPQHFNNLSRVENTALYNSTPNKPMSPQHFNNLSRVENTALYNSTPNKQMSPQHFNNLSRVENTALYNSTPNKPMSPQHFNNLSRVENTALHNSTPNKLMSPQHFNNLSRVENTALHNSTSNKPMSPQHFNNLPRVENTAHHGFSRSRVVLENNLTIHQTQNNYIIISDNGPAETKQTVFAEGDVNQSNHMTTNVKEMETTETNEPKGTKRHYNSSCTEEPNYPKLPKISAPDLIEIDSNDDDEIIVLEDITTETTDPIPESLVEETSPTSAMVPLPAGLNSWKLQKKKFFVCDLCKKLLSTKFYDLHMKSHQTK